MSRAGHSMIYTSYTLGHLVVHMNTLGLHYVLSSRHCWYTWPTKRHYLWHSWTVFFDLMHKLTKQVFHRIQLIMLTSHLDTYISRYGDFVLTDTTDYFTPCACMQSKYYYKLTIIIHNTMSFIQQGMMLWSSHDKTLCKTCVATPFLLQY